MANRDLFREIVESLIVPASEGVGDAAENLLRLCANARPEAVEALGDVVELEVLLSAIEGYKQRQVFGGSGEAQAEIPEELARDDDEFMSTRQAARLLREKGRPNFATTVGQLEELIHTDQARELVNLLHTVGQIQELQIPWGLKFSSYLNEAAERIVTRLLQLVVEWMEDGAKQDASRLARDFGEVGLAAVQRLIKAGRLPFRVETYMGPDALDRVRSAANQPIALRCALLGVEYHERSVSRCESPRADRREMAPA